MTVKQKLGCFLVSIPFLTLIGAFVHSAGFWTTMGALGVVCSAVLCILLGLMLATGEFDE